MKLVHELRLQLVAGIGECAHGEVSQTVSPWFL